MFIYLFIYLLFIGLFIYLFICLVIYLFIYLFDNLYIYLFIPNFIPQINLINLLLKFENRKHDTDFSINVHYYWLLLLILLKIRFSVAVFLTDTNIQWKRVFAGLPQGSILGLLLLNMKNLLLKMAEMEKYWESLLITTLFLHASS